MIEIKKEGPVFTITLSSPPHNILNIAMLKEIQEALRELLSGPYRILVFKSGEKAFSAGADIKEHLPEQVREMIKTFGEVFLLMHSFDGISVACVNGAALGGGCELALFCDVVLAGEKARFGQPEIKLGLFPPVALAAYPALFSPKAALDFILSGEALSAGEAYRLGFVNKLLGAGNFDEEARKYLGRFADLSDSSFQLTKKTFKKLHMADFPEKLKAAEDIYLDVLAKTEDGTEGLTAFLEKRKPVWNKRNTV
ncbi:MAG: enoyl-CoA hydratase/isomerase family protein [Elusimicrobiota bacterium]